MSALARPNSTRWSPTACSAQFQMSPRAGSNDPPLKGGNGTGPRLAVPTAPVDSAAVSRLGYSLAFSDTSSTQTPFPVPLATL